MDDHFEQMLAPSTAAAYNQPKYIQTEAFEGSKFGFIFKKGAKGLGYYYDHIQKLPTKVSIQAFYTPPATHYLSYFHSQFDS